MSLVFVSIKIQFEDQFYQFPKGNSKDMIPLWNSLKITIPKNREENKMFLNESDLIFSRNMPKKYAAGIKLINQRSCNVCRPNNPKVILKNNQKVM
jgi:hypothetical protein